MCLNCATDILDRFDYESTTIKQTKNQYYNTYVIFEEI